MSSLSSSSFSSLCYSQAFGSNRRNMGKPAFRPYHALIGTAFPRRGKQQSKKFTHYLTFHHALPTCAPATTSKMRTHTRQQEKKPSTTMRGYVRQGLHPQGSPHSLASRTTNHKEHCPFLPPSCLPIRPRTQPASIANYKKLTPSHVPGATWSRSLTLRHGS